LYPNKVCRKLPWQDATGILFCKYMSQRRMFSPEIVESEEFLTMPVSCQALYFHLGMHADDDGFVQPKLIMRASGFTDDDLKVLLAKRFLLSFQSGVVVIKHWLIHNMIRLDRYKNTRFLEEKKLLKIKENKAYTEINNLGCQNDNQLAPQVRLGEVRLGKVNMSPKGEKLKPLRNDQLLVEYYFQLKGWQDKPVKERNAVFPRFLKASKQILELTDLEQAKAKLLRLKTWADNQELDWTLETLIKKWLEVDELPQEKVKRAFIEGDKAYKKGDEWWVILSNGEHKKYIGSLSNLSYE